MRGTMIAIAAVALLAGCSTYDSLTQRIAQRITPYRITVVQGNFVSKEAAAQMKFGMSRAEVRQVLGTPLLSDMFHADRWDYIFYFKRGSTSIVQQRDFVVNFTGDAVTSWSGGEDLPSNLELLAEIDGDRRGKKAAAVAASAPGAASAPVVDTVAPPVVFDPARSPSGEAAAAGALSKDPNAQAAQAANRATNAVPSSSRDVPPPVRSNPPAANAVPNTPGQQSTPQFQFHRPPPPVSPNQGDNPVGPTGPQGSAAPASSAPLTSQPSSGTAG